MANEQKRSGRNWKTLAEKKKLAKLLSEGTPVGEALRLAGWSELQSKKGYAAVPRDVLGMLPKKTKALMDKGKALKADRSAMEDLIIGRLGENIVQGKDAGTQSAKVLGSHRDLNMWTPDQLSGVVILETPPKIAERIEKTLKESSRKVNTNLGSARFSMVLR